MPSSVTFKARTWRVPVFEADEVHFGDELLRILHIGMLVGALVCRWYKDSVVPSETREGD